MAERQHFQPFIESQPPLDWNFEDLRAADQDMFNDEESELSDMPSSASPMDIDMDPFGSDQISHPEIDPDRFSVQSLLPLEVVELITINIADDTDLLNFILTCKDFASAIVLEKSTVWRTRFLARYDHPIIEGPYEFRIAYQLREMVLRKFPSFADAGRARSRVALEVLRDMVLESYNDPKSTKLGPSRNLHTLSSPGRAPYMHEFLSSPFFAYGTAPYGKQNRLFAALQIIFSHLVLHPSSEFAVPSDVAAPVKASRENYDLTIVYLYGPTLKTLYHLEASQLEGPGPHNRTMILDLNALLHIRNFWHGHLASTATSMYAGAVLTYGEMARTLSKRDHAPRQWNTPIQKSIAVFPHWFGHYSCTHPTPRKIMDIEEHQTCAEDWIHQYGNHGVHPLTLDIATTGLTQRGWWPPIFATIPILESTISEAGPGNGHLFIRGIAPFLSPLKHPDMYPTYTSLRVRGIIHALSEQEEIPGWRRIVMVLYKPTSRYLLAVLDENGADDADDPFGQIEPMVGFQVPNENVESNGGEGPALSQNEMQSQNPHQVQNQNEDQTQPTTVPPSPEEAEKAMKEELEAREELTGPLGPVYLTRDFIAEMEDKLHPPEELAWEDLNYAYVYEGIIIPGGKIMMGRYWRFGPPTVIDGFELGDGADRGPWVFWC